MKNKLTVILSLLLCFTACDEDESIHYIGLLHKFTVPEGQAITVNDGEEAQILIDLTSINDSRCPSNANCISAGNALATFIVNEKEEIELCIGLCSDKVQQADSALFHVDHKAYYLKLVDVKPYPVLPDEREKSAVISVFK